MVVSFWFLGLMWATSEFNEILGGAFFWVLGIFVCGLIAYGIVGLILLPWSYEDYQSRGFRWNTVSNHLT
jgi:hypothetical protein